MPEGDTIHRTADTLRKALAGRPVTRFESVYPALTRVDRDAPLAGRTIEAVTASGKHLLIHFSGGLALRTHLRMHGSWHLYRPGERWWRPAHAMRVLVATPEWVAVGFEVPDAELIPDGRPSRRGVLEALGPDLLGEAFDAGEARARLRARGDATIETALLDQTALAGIGNVYKSEVLFACGVHPFTPVAHLDDPALDRLIATARRLLIANTRPRTPAARGARSTTFALDPKRGLWIYGRGGRPCRRCGTAIERRVSGAGARLTYWCPRCQPTATRIAARG